MSLGNLYFRNTRLLVLTIALIVVAGLAAFTLLPRREDPRITPRFGLVLTPYPGASAERVESLVTEKIEEELREIEEIAVVESDSRPGISAIRIELDDSVPESETGEIWSRVRDQLDDVRPQLPAAALDPDFSDQETDAFALIVALTWRRDEPVAPAVLQRLGEELEHEIQLDNGTEETELFGANREEIVVEIDPSRIAALGLTAGRIAQAVRESDAKVSAGLLRSDKSRLVIEVEGEFETLTRLRRTPIRYGEGDAVVRLDEIATVRKTVAEPATELAFVDGLPAISIGVRMKLDQRIDKFAASMRELLGKFEKRLPRGVTLDLVFDQSTYTEARLDNLFANLGLGALFVILVIFFMMGWRSAFLVAAALPLTSLMVLAGLNMLGVPIHQMSVTGLIIALGLLIDNAIVMVDEVSHRRQDGAPAGEAVRYAVSKLALPLLGSTLTTVFAFMPLVLMPGPAGEFVGTIAVSVILSILSSLFLAVTVIPALTGLFGASAEKRGFLHQGFSNARLTKMYRATLDALFRRPWLALVLALILPTAGFIAGQDLEEQFFPPTDRDQFPIEIRLASHASLDKTKTTALAMRERLLEYDQVDRVHFYVGASAQKFYYNLLEGEDGNATYAQALVQLKTWKGASALLRRIQHDLDREFPGTQTIVRQLEQGPPFAAPIEVRVVGPDPDVLYALGEKLRGELIQVPGVTHTRSSLTAGTPKLVVRHRRRESQPRRLQPPGAREPPARNARRRGRRFARRRHRGVAGARSCRGGQSLAPRSHRVARALPRRIRVDAAQCGRRGDARPGDRQPAAPRWTPHQHRSGIPGSGPVAGPRPCRVPTPHRVGRTPRGLHARARRRSVGARRRRRQTARVRRHAARSHGRDDGAELRLVPHRRADRFRRGRVRRARPRRAVDLRLPVRIHGHRGHDGPRRRRDSGSGRRCASPGGPRRTASPRSTRGGRSRRARRTSRRRGGWCRA